MTIVVLILSQLEEIKNKNQEDKSQMTMNLETRQSQYYNNLES